VFYKNEAFALFEDLMNLIWGDFARMIFHVQVTVEGEDGPQPPPARRVTPGSSSSTGGRNVTYSGGSGTPSGAMALAAAAGGAGETYAEEEDASMFPPPVEQRRVDESEQLGRNDPCWCGSGKKFKKCHGS